MFVKKVQLSLATLMVSGIGFKSATESTEGFDKSLIYLVATLFLVASAAPWVAGANKPSKRLAPLIAGVISIMLGISFFGIAFFGDDSKFSEAIIIPLAQASGIPIARLMFGVSGCIALLFAYSAIKSILKGWK